MIALHGSVGVWYGMGAGNQVHISHIIIMYDGTLCYCTLVLPLTEFSTLAVITCTDLTTGLLARYKSLNQN